MDVTLLGYQCFKNRWEKMLGILDFKVYPTPPTHVECVCAGNYSRKPVDSQSFCQFLQVDFISSIEKVNFYENKKFNAVNCNVLCASIHMCILSNYKRKCANRTSLPVFTLICRSRGIPTRNGYPLLMKPSSRSTRCPLYHSERKTPGTSLRRVQFQKVAILFTRCKTKK